MTYRVPSKDYGRQYAALRSELEPELARVFREENPVLGAPVAAFERDFAAYTGTAHAVGVGSGTDALVLALRSLHVGPGDEVITAANTFAATVTAILTVGARPVLADADPATHTIDVNGVARAITAATRAVIPVHLYGRLCAMPALIEICSGHGIAIVEDAAQAHGARGGGADRRAGAFGRLGCFSFHPSKNLGAFGDGGAITTDEAELASTLRELRNLGKRTKYEFAHVAPNSKLDTLQATILGIKLRHLESWNERRREIAAHYEAELRPLASAGLLELPLPPAVGEHVFHLFAVHTDRRDDLRRFLKESGINAGLHYPTPVHLQPWPLNLGYRAGDFPVAEASAAREISLPISPELDAGQIAFVGERIRAFFAG